MTPIGIKVISLGEGIYTRKVVKESQGAYYISLDGCQTEVIQRNGNVSADGGWYTIDNSEEVR